MTTADHLCFNIRSIGSLWSSPIIMGVASNVGQFQYPLYRITLVVWLSVAASVWLDLVSISALSDHFGRLRLRENAVAIGACFNIRSIGSLWSSNDQVFQRRLAKLFQYPLYRITLVVNEMIMTKPYGGLCFNIRSIGSLWSSQMMREAQAVMARFNIRSIGSLWSSCVSDLRIPPARRFNIRSIGSLWSSAGATLRQPALLLFQYPLYRITLVVLLNDALTAG